MTDAGTAYREAGVRGASGLQMVVSLYDRAIEDLHRALDALAKGDIAARTRSIDHALCILGHLQATLDFERGGDVSTKLSRFYDLARGRLLEAQAQQSSTIVDEQLLHLSSLRDAWAEVERRSRPLPPDPEKNPSGTPEPQSSQAGGWTA